MGKENIWSEMSDEEVFAAEKKISDYKPEGQRAILKEAKRRRNPDAEQETVQHLPKGKMW